MQRNLKIYANRDAAHAAWTAACELATERTDKKFVEALAVITDRGRVQTEFWCFAEDLDRRRVVHLPWDTLTIEDDCSDEDKALAATITLRGSPP
jgi:hypothetical protein